MNHFVVKGTDPIETGHVMEKTHRGDVLRRSLGTPILLDIATKVFRGEEYMSVSRAFDIAEAIIEEYNKRVSKGSTGDKLPTEPKCMFSGE